jgi:hypothetical protein
MGGVFFLRERNVVLNGDAEFVIEKEEENPNLVDPSNSALPPPTPPSRGGRVRCSGCLFAHSVL